MGRREHLGVLLAHAGEVVDVEEPAMAAGGRVDIEEPLPKLWIGPEAVCSSIAMWLGTRSRTSPSPASGVRSQRPQPILAAELVRHAGRVDHVVTVARSCASL